MPPTTPTPRKTTDKGYFLRVVATYTDLLSVENGKWRGNGAEDNR